MGVFANVIELGRLLVTRGRLDRARRDIAKLVGQEESDSLFAVAQLTSFGDGRAELRFLEVVLARLKRGERALGSGEPS